jgi:hypothetical protein
VTNDEVPHTGTNAKKLCNNNSRVANAIPDGLSYFRFVKVMHCKSKKEIWEKLHIMYEVYFKFKKEKLQTYKRQFESLKMKEEETIA